MATTTAATAGIPDPGTVALLRAPQVTSIAANPAGPGYWVEPQYGDTTAGGGAPFYGVINTYSGWITPTPDGGGYWVTNEEGQIFAAGNADPEWGTVQAHSGYRPQNTNGGFTNPIASVASTPSGKGLWALDSQGNVWTLGDARPYGAPSDKKAIGKGIGVQLVPTASGHGYTVLADDGGVFTYGDAVFHGSSGGNKPGGGVVYTGLATTANDQGYWMLDSAGNVHPFGNAALYGRGTGTNSKYTNIAAMPGDAGYYLVQNNGTVSTFTALSSTPSGTFTNPGSVHLVVGKHIRFKVNAPGAAGITVRGTLPAGLRFSDRGHSRAVITGTPRRCAAGHHVVTLIATDAKGAVLARQRLHFHVTTRQLKHNGPGV